MMIRSSPPLFVAPWDSPYYKCRPTYFYFYKWVSYLFIKIFGKVRKGMAARIDLGDFTGGDLNYPREFHNLDVCKDAKEGNGIPIALDPVLGGKTLFDIALRSLGFNICKGYSDKLHRLEASIQANLNANKSVLQKQINRLKKKDLYGGKDRDTGLPMSIESVIRDSGNAPESYREGLTILEIASDFTDPASRTYLPETERFPEIGIPLLIDDSVFRSMLNGRDIIRNFSAVVTPANCDITFSLIVKYKDQGGEVPYGTRIIWGVRKDRTYNPIPGFRGRDASQFFKGNNTKNTFFNNNQAAWDVRKTRDEAFYHVGDAIGYLIAKEFFGDALIVLIARKYKSAESPHGSAAVFTSDNAVKALSSALEVDHIATNSSKLKKTGTEEAVACLFSLDPRAELQAQKEQEIIRIVKWNDDIRKFLKEHVYDGMSIEKLGLMNEAQINFLRNAFADNIVRINDYLRSVRLDDNNEGFLQFKLKVKGCEIREFVKGFIPGRNVLIMHPGIYDPIFDIPLELRPAGYPPMKRKFMEYLQSIKTGLLGPQGPLGRRRGGFFGGGFERIEEVETQPTETLKSIIQEELAKFDLFDVYGVVDVEDIYNYLYWLYDLECKVSYNSGVIGRLIGDFLEGGIPSMHYDEALHAYNDILTQVENEEVELEEVVNNAGALPFEKQYEAVVANPPRKVGTVGTTGMNRRMAEAFKRLKNTRRKAFNNKRKLAFPPAPMQWAVGAGRRRKTRKARRKTNKK